MNARFLFVGERRSTRAQQMGVYWESGRLAAKTLHDSLRALGLDPQRQVYLNLYEDAPASAPLVLKAGVLSLLRKWSMRGPRRNRVTIVAMGRHVQRELTRAEIPHLALTHPAARGAIRRTERYQAHVAEVLDLSPQLAQEVV